MTHQTFIRDDATYEVKFGEQHTSIIATYAHGLRILYRGRSGVWKRRRLDAAQRQVLIEDFVLDKALIHRLDELEHFTKASLPA